MQDENQTNEANTEPTEAAAVVEATPAQAEQPQAERPQGRGPRGPRGGGRGRGGGDRGGRGRRDDRRGGRGGDHDGGGELIEKLVDINRVPQTATGGKAAGSAALTAAAHATRR